MLKIIIPLAGSSDFFTKAGYHYPKPLVEIAGKTMIEHVIAGPSQIQEEHQFIFIIKEEDASKYHIDNTLRILCPNSEIIKLKRNTKGSLCSILMAIENINGSDELLILNGDQVIDVNFNEINNFWQQEQVTAGIVTFSSVHPRWSYARIENNEVVQTAEKNPISTHAIAGYYYFKEANLFFKAAFQSIMNNEKTEENFFISPVINQLILKNKRVKNFPIDNKLYHSLYSPQLVQEYERTFTSKS